jgi:putative sigma-54 modulation protein
MLKRIDITGLHYEVDDTTKRYVMRKIGRLDRYASRHARKSLRAEVMLSQVNKAHSNKYECEIILHVPDEVIIAKDSTLNMLAAVDIVEAKLRTQLKKYKDERLGYHGHHNLIGRLKRRFRRSDLDTDLQEDVPSVVN